MTIGRFFIVAMLGGSVGLVVADLGRAPGIQHAARWEAPGLDRNPAAGMVGDFGAGVLSLPPITLIKSTPKPSTKPPSVECNPAVQIRTGGRFWRVCP
jgi:hypothetical protein